MAITIYDVLKLEKFKDFKVIAGREGLTRKIKKIGILDYERDDLIEENFVEGEFVVSTLVVIKDDIEELYKLVERMILVGISGLAIKNVYFNTIPDEVIELADRENFPIMIFSNVYFEDLITSVINFIKQNEENEFLVSKIDSILYSNLDSVVIRKIAYEINNNFKEKNIVAFCKRKDIQNSIMTEIFTNVENDKSFKIISYKDGYIIINTFEKIDSDKIVGIILRRLENLGFNLEKYTIGISSLYERLGELNYSINESLYAYKYSMIYKKDISFFNQIGVNKILLPLLDNQWILKYHDEMIEPLLMYDRKNNTELLNTAIKYIENNGDIKATSQELFQHSNTIRYRIEKIYKILSKNCKRESFYEELALGIRIHNLLNMDL
ncbi:PucR family transcriptional regulator [Tepidibacter thalassicus]|nr:PucR family transcriptional regulator [Tepidibacter thalassicus]